MKGELLSPDTHPHGTHPKEVSNVMAQGLFKNLLKIQYDEDSHILKDSPLRA